MLNIVYLLLFLISCFLFVYYILLEIKSKKNTVKKNESVANTRRQTLKGKELVLNRIESDISKIKVEKNEADKLPIVLVGNKYDLKDQRTVSEEEAKEFRG